MKPYIVILILLITSTSTLADENQEDVINHYKSYVNHKKSGDIYKAIAQLESAYKLLPKAYPEPSKNKASVTYKLGFELMHAHPKSEIHRAEKLLLESIEIYESVYGSNNPALIDPYMDLGVARLNINHFKRKTYMPAFENAMDLADNDPELLAILQYEIGVKLINKGLASPTSKRLLKKSYTYFKKNNDPRHSLNALYLAKYMIARNDGHQASEYLVDALNGFEKQNQSTSYIMTTKALLVRSLEMAGERDTATKYCQEIAKAMPWGGDGECSGQVILYNPMGV